MAEKSVRTYSSPLREARAEQTRDRVVDAALQVLGSQDSAFTMPAVAEAADVSLPTVYRLFSNKESLANAAGEAVRSRVGIDASDVEDIEELLRRQRQHIASASEGDERLIRALYTLNAQPLDPSELRTREEILKGVVEDAVQGLGPEDRTHFTQITSLLFSSTTATALWRFRLLNSEGADLMDWLVRTLIAGMRANKEEK